MKKTVLGAVAICAGAPLLALGVGTATASADTNTRADTRAALQRIDRNDVAISFGGIQLVKTGDSRAYSRGLSLAIASNNSVADAEGFRNLAIATNNSNAAADGKLNTAIADNNSLAIASFSNFGNRNTAVALNGSTANIPSGSFNTVRSTNNSSATVEQGTRNTVTASDGSNVVIYGDAETVTARCGGVVNLGDEVNKAASNQTVTSAPCEAG